MKTPTKKQLAAWHKIIRQNAKTLKITKLESCLLLLSSPEIVKMLTKQGIIR